MQEDNSILMQTKQSPEEFKCSPEIFETPVRRQKDLERTRLASTGFSSPNKKSFPSLKTLLVTQPLCYLNSPRLQEKLDTTQSKGTEERLITKASFDSESTHTHVVFEDENNQEVGLRWCAFCQRETVTQRQFRNSAKTLWASIAIFFSGGFLGCFLLPYVANTCKDSSRQCVRCKHYV